MRGCTAEAAISKWMSDAVTTIARTARNEAMDNISDLKVILEFAC